MAAEADFAGGEPSAIPMQEEVELQFGVGLQIRLKPPPTTVPLIIKSPAHNARAADADDGQDGQDGAGPALGVA